MTEYGLYVLRSESNRRINEKDCTVRAIAKALNLDWEAAHVLLDNMSIKMGTMPDSNKVWPAVLRMNGFRRDIIPNTCPDCYSAEDFCNDNPHGTFVLFFGDHVATIVDGVIYDTWDSSMEIPIYYWYKKEEEKNGKQRR